MSSRFHVLSLPFCSVIAGLAGLAGCSSTSTNDSPADSGSNPVEVGTDAADVGSDTPATCDKAPPTGYTQVVPASSDANTSVGIHTAITFSKAGYPVIAYNVADKTANTGTVYSIRWDPCLGAWSTPLKIDSGLALSFTLPTRGLSIALDPVDGRIGIAYGKLYIIKEPNPTSAAFVAWSTDDGKTFSAGTKVSIHGVETGPEQGDIEQIDSPQIALRSGKTYVAYNQNSEACGPATSGDLPPCQPGIVLATGGATSGPFTQEIMKDGLDPVYSGYAHAALGMPIGLAVDSAGVPAIAGHVSPPTAYDLKLFFFRPGALGTLITDSQNHQNDDGSASLAFDGTRPRVLTRINSGSNGNGNLIFIASTDGSTWSAPVQLPLDSDTNTPQSQALLIDGTGGVVALSQTNESPGSPFDGPKFWHSSDLTTFTIGSPGLGGSTATPRGYYMSGALTSGGKIRMAFEGDIPVVTNTGVVYWGEP